MLLCIVRVKTQRLHSVVLFSETARCVNIFLPDAKEKKKKDSIWKHLRVEPEYPKGSQSLMPFSLPYLNLKERVRIGKKLAKTV